MGKKNEGHVQLSQSLGSDFEGENSGPKFGGLEEHVHSSGQENAYGNVECSGVESDGGDLGDGIGIKHVYWDNTWN
jgi:hypothetical protein